MKYLKLKNIRIELSLGNKVCFVKPTSDLICDTIVRGHLSKKFGGLQSANLYVLVADNKLNFYKIVEKAFIKNIYAMTCDFTSIQKYIIMVIWRLTLNFWLSH